MVAASWWNAPSHAAAAERECGSPAGVILSRADGIRPRQKEKNNEERSDFNIVDAPIWNGLGCSCSYHTHSTPEWYINQEREIWRI